MAICCLPPSSLSSSSSSSSASFPGSSHYDRAGVRKLKFGDFSIEPRKLTGFSVHFWYLFTLARAISLVWSLVSDFIALAGLIQQRFIAGIIIFTLTIVFEIFFLYRNYRTAQTIIESNFISDCFLDRLSYYSRLFNISIVPSQKSHKISSSWTSWEYFYSLRKNLNWKEKLVREMISILNNWKMLIFVSLIQFIILQISLTFCDEKSTNGINCPSNTKFNSFQYSLKVVELLIIFGWLFICLAFYPCVRGLMKFEKPEIWLKFRIDRLIHSMAIEEGKLKIEINQENPVIKANDIQIAVESERNSKESADQLVWRGVPDILQENSSRNNSPRAAAAANGQFSSVRAPTPTAATLLTCFNCQQKFTVAAPPPVNSNLSYQIMVECPFCRAKIQFA